MSSSKTIKLETGTELKYNFFSNNSGSFDFRVRAKREARILLTTQATDKKPLFQVIIGAYRNSKTIIRKSRKEPDVQAQTLGILSEEEFRGFSIRWKVGLISVCREGNSIPIVSWTKKEEKFAITHIGVCTGWGAVGSWIIREPETGDAKKGGTETEKWKNAPKLQTVDHLDYKFFPNSSGTFDFWARAPHDVHVALSTTASVSKPLFEIMIGAWKNHKTIICKDREDVDVVTSTPGILSDQEFRGFSVKWEFGNIHVFREGSTIPILSWLSKRSCISFNFVGICTARGAIGSWIIEKQGQGEGRGVPRSSLVPKVDSWKPASDGKVPPEALQANDDGGEAVFIARARIEGNLIPGKLICSLKKCYVCWGGVEHSVHEYEVFCGRSETWISVSGGPIPKNAITGGYTKDGEILYVGKVFYEGTLYIGQVVASQGVCYVSYEGQEKSFTSYEILVSSSTFLQLTTQ